MDLKRKKQTFRYLGQVIDCINVLMAIIIVTSAIILAIDVKKFIYLFPVVFTASAIMNIAIGIKSYKRKKTTAAIVSWIMGLVMIAIAIFALMVVLA